MEIPAHLGYLSSTSACGHTLLSNHQAPSPHLSPQSARSSLRSTLQPSCPDLGSHSGLPSGKKSENCHLIDTSVPLGGEPHQIFNSRSLIRSHQSEHNMPLIATGDRDKRNSEISSHCGPFVNLFPEKEHSEPRERSQASSGSATRKGDDCDMELNPQMVDVSKGLRLNESALQLLKCNHFISRVSSLCGETIGNTYTVAESGLCFLWLC